VWKSGSMSHNVTIIPKNPHTFVDVDFISALRRNCFIVANHASQRRWPIGH
jgi:hypothetical protein